MNSKQDILEQIYQLAYEYESKVGSCPQCVLAAIKETLNIGDENIIKSADALAGGTSLSTRGTCGALVGGMLALSSVVGREYTDFKNGKRKRRVFNYAKLLYDRFIEEYDSPLCSDVQQKIFGRSFDLWDVDDYNKFEKAGGHVDKCPSVSGNTAKWTAEIILNKLKMEIE
jgi:C_GCAxxG_C_C family probable redox protein